MPLRTHAVGSPLLRSYAVEKSRSPEVFHDHQMAALKSFFLFFSKRIFLLFSGGLAALEACNSICHHSVTAVIILGLEALFLLHALSSVKSMEQFIDILQEALSDPYLEDISCVVMDICKSGSVIWLLKLIAMITFRMICEDTYL